MAGIAFFDLDRTSTATGDAVGSPTSPRRSPQPDEGREYGAEDRAGQLGFGVEDAVVAAFGTCADERSGDSAADD